MPTKGSKRVEVLCEFCQRPVGGRVSLMRHLAANHRTEYLIKNGHHAQKFICTAKDCGWDFGRKEALDRHKRTVHGL